MSWLRRDDLRRVLSSLLRAELTAHRRRWHAEPPNSGDTSWTVPDEGAPLEDGDSLDRLWLAAAVNEMFCLYEAKVEDSLQSAPTFEAWLDIVEAGWNREGQRVTFTTSGSTGVPKRCTHTQAFLARETEFFAHRFSDIRRIVALVPAHHIYGFLFTAMLPSHRQLPVLVADHLAPGALHRELRPGDLVVAMPSRWEWLARSLPQWPENVHGLTSTAPIAAPLTQQLLAQGLATLTEIYGSSETAGVGVRSFPEERYTLLPYWRFTSPTGGTQPTGAPSVLTDTAGATYPLQDQLETNVNGSFLVQARLDGAIQVGGTNVFPARLEEQLRALPGVAEAAVRLESEPGNPRLKAFIVPAGNSPPEGALAQQLDLWAKGFPAPERIRSFTFGPSLPRNALGKLADWFPN